MADTTIKINRAPVLTLWAVVVSERLGHSPETALTLGKAVAGLNANSKARRLGLVEAKKPEDKEKPATRAGKSVTVLGRPVPAIQTKQGLRATAKGEAIKPESVQRYLAGRFGDDLPAVRAAFEALAKSYSPKELEASAYSLYEQFRPQIPEGQRGWGAAGELDLGRVRRLAAKAKK
jgi:hypothetical protein